MAKKQAPLVDTGKPLTMGALFVPDEKTLTLEGVYRTRKGLYKMEQPHTQRLNMVLPPQLLEAFETVVEREHGARSKSAVIESLIIEYCKDNGVSIGE